MYSLYIYETPIGKITIGCNERAVTSLSFGEHIPVGAALKETPLHKKAYEELVEYLEGKRNFFDLPLEPKGTEFQKRVWKELLEIPYGEVRSYKYIAEKAGNVKACRAVGLANNRNPIVIFIPCHRVIGASGKLVGYGGGLDLKEKLLLLEKSHG